MSNHFSEIDREQLIEKLEIFKIHGRDKHGRNILRIIGKSFPAQLLSVDVLKRYLEEKIYPRLEKKPFSVLYIHTGAQRTENFPGISALRSIYDSIPVSVKDNLHTVYFLHPGLQARIFLATFGRLLFSSGGLYGKLRYISRTDYLWDHLRRNEVEIPEFVHDHDEDLEYRPMMDYGLESDHPRVYGAPVVDSPVSMYSMRMRRWEDLAGDVLQKIEELLILYADKVRICSVCRSWRSVLPELPNNNQLEAQLPWLLVPISCDKSGQASHGLFNLQDKKTYYLDLHNLKLPLVIGSSHGWLVCHANRSVYIINPITEAQVQLPPTYHSIRKIILSSSPSLSDNYLAVAMCHYRCLLAYCKQGDDKWTAIGDEDSYEDIIFHEGQLYALTCDGKLMVIEIAASPRATILTPPCPELISYNHKIYLLESSTGILMVGRMRKFVTTTYEYEYSGRFRKVRTLEQMVTYRYNVFKFDVSCSQWNKVSHIGDDMLFLSHNFSLSTSCRNLHGLKGNSICFIEDSSKDGYHIAVIDIESKSIQNLPACKCNGDCPSECPIWLTPTF